jgi:hypothetical protein
MGKVTPLRPQPYREGVKDVMTEFHRLVKEAEDRFDNHGKVIFADIMNKLAARCRKLVNPDSGDKA